MLFFIKKSFKINILYLLPQEEFHYKHIFIKPTQYIQKNVCKLYNMYFELFLFLTQGLNKGEKIFFKKKQPLPKAADNDSECQKGTQNF